jgi:glutamate/tyrosine decarboxylase-like PLP-dependent enzyme
LGGCSCVSMLADLYHAEGVCGTGTVGSSEAVLLAGIAMKRRWSEKRKAAGLPPAQCNMVCSSVVHVTPSKCPPSFCWVGILFKELFWGKMYPLG